MGNNLEKNTIYIINKTGTDWISINKDFLN
jgi:hypothetical protein